MKSQYQSQVREILAAEHRGEPDAPANWETYHGLRRHLEYTGTLDSAEPTQRLLAFDMAKYLRYRGDWAGGLELAERVLSAWRPFGADDVQTLRMRLEQANLLRARGEHDRAFDLDAEALERLTSGLGEDHAYTLYATGSLAADHRERGDYQVARQLEERTLARWRTAFGDDHYRTLMSANNFGVSLRLVGEFTAASEIHLDTLRRRTRTLGESDYWTVQSAVAAGRSLREVGDLHGSLERLTGVLAVCRHTLGEEHFITISAAKETGITLRRLGHLDGALRLAEETVRHADSHLGPRNPLALSCSLELACVLSEHARHEPAIERTEDVLASYRRANGEAHLFTLCAAHDLAVILFRSGETGGALSLLQGAAAQFPRVLAPTPPVAEHAYTTVCRMSLSSALFHAGSFEEARRLDELCHRHALAAFGPEHPTVIAAANNLALSRLRTGAVKDAEDQLGDVLRTARQILGEDHQDVAAIQTRQRVLSVIEPPPT